MRLAPIDKPAGLKMSIAYFFTQRVLGKVITPMKVLYPRVPGLLNVGYAIQKFQMNGLKLEPALHFLISSWTAQVNGCGFCIDIARAMAVREHIGMEKFNALAEYRTDPMFSDRERAALAYAEEATKVKRVGDETWAALRDHFDDREIVEITWINAIENYYNLINIPLQIDSDGLCAIAQRRLTDGANDAA